jgi:hypothetical protein
MPWWYQDRHVDRRNRIGRTLPAMVVALMLTSGIAAARSETDWEAPLTISAGRATLRLCFGQKEDATSFVDNRYDVPAMPGGSLQAGFDLGGGSFWRDIRSPEEVRQTWTLHIRGPKLGEMVRLSWESPPPGEWARLVDPAAGRSIDLKNNMEYSFRNDGPRTLHIEVGSREKTDDR